MNTASAPSSFPGNPYENARVQSGTDRRIAVVHYSVSWSGDEQTKIGHRSDEAHDPIRPWMPVPFAAQCLSGKQLRLPTLIYRKAQLWFCYHVYLMNDAASDSGDAFKKLYEANYQRVRRLMARIAGPHESEDLAQAVFAKAAKALPSFRGDAQSSTWVFRIATHVASDWLRSRSAHEAIVTVQLPEAQNEEANVKGAISAHFDNTLSPEQELARKEMADCIRREIRQLAKIYQEVLILGELGGFTDGEVANILGISRANAKVRSHRARAQLKKAIEARCDFYRQELECEPSTATCCASSKGLAHSSRT